MTGHAFQALLTDEDMRGVFKVVNTHLKPGGVFVFESRNPALPWERLWHYDIALNTDFGPVRESHHFKDWSDYIMTFELRYEFPDREILSKSRLRFADYKTIEENFF